MEADIDLERVLRKGSKSFHLASRLLPARVRTPTLALYAFCRHADDAVDDAATDFATRASPSKPFGARVDRVYSARRSTTWWSARLRARSSTSPSRARSRCPGRRDEWDVLGAATRASRTFAPTGSGRRPGRDDDDVDHGAAGCGRPSRARVTSASHAAHQIAREWGRTRGAVASICRRRCSRRRGVDRERFLAVRARGERGDRDVSRGCSARQSSSTHVPTPGSHISRATAGRHPVGAPRLRGDRRNDPRRDYDSVTEAVRRAAAPQALAVGARVRRSGAGRAEPLAERRAPRRRRSSAHWERASHDAATALGTRAPPRGRRARGTNRALDRCAGGTGRWTSRAGPGTGRALSTRTSWVAGGGLSLLLAAELSARASTWWWWERARAGAAPSRRGTRVTRS